MRLESSDFSFFVGKSILFRIYLEELEKTGDRSLALGMVQLIVEPEETAGAEARQLIGKARQLADEDLSRDVVEFIEIVLNDYLLSR